MRLYQKQKFIRNTIIILATIVALISCFNSVKAKTLCDNNITHQQSDTTKNTSKRQILIAELKKLGQTISSGDKEIIADLFEFPLSRNSYEIYINDKTYMEQIKSNDNKITRVMFLQHYKEIIESIWLDQLNNLFHNINIDSLLYKDTLGYEAYIKTKPCFYSYQIEVINDTISLRMNSNSNQDYQTKEISEYDIPENSSEICEHNFWWIFKFNGYKLKLINIYGAD